MTLHGIGTDLCDTRRLAAVLARRGERFAQRVLTPAELAQYRQRRALHAGRGLNFLATRFAAKEAFSKAIGLGLRAPMGWQACEVDSLPSGQPRLLLHGELAAWFAARRLVAHLSLSDDGDFAVAFVVVEAHPGA